MKNYVLGFIFDQNLDKVLLIKKNRPDFQKGKLNGIGGSIELNETALEAMRRETKEECGLDIKEWVNFGKLFNPNLEYDIELFYTVTNEIYNFKQIEDEKVSIYDLNDYYPSDAFRGRLGYPNKNYYKNLNRMINIDWMIIMILNHYYGWDKIKYFQIEEK